MEKWEQNEDFHWKNILPTKYDLFTIKISIFKIFALLSKFFIAFLTWIATKSKLTQYKFYAFFF